MYCVKCGVKLQEGIPSCPLCQTPVWNPDADAGSPAKQYALTLWYCKIDMIKPALFKSCIMKSYIPYFYHIIRTPLCMEK